MKRLICLIVGVILFVCILSGCGNSGRNAGSPSGNNTAGLPPQTNITNGQSQRPDEKKIEKDNKKTDDSAKLNKEPEYSIEVPKDEFRHERDYDDGVLEEHWENKTVEDVEIKISTYNGVTTDKAKEYFMRDNNDYFFEDETTTPVCGVERDGDVLKFEIYEGHDKVYIVSWEYPVYATDEYETKLLEIAHTFNVILN